jgi:hypothetical protein
VDTVTNAGAEARTEATMKSVILRDVTPCGQVDIRRRRAELAA